MKLSVFRPNNLLPRISTSLHKLVGGDFKLNLNKKHKGEWQNSYGPLVTVEISKEAILHNYNWYKKHIGEDKLIAPVLKSNAYGHGLVETAKVFETIIPHNANTFFAVDSIFEAYTLRAGGVKNKILILGYVDPKVISKNTLPNLIFMITSLEQARMLVHERNLVVKRLFNRIFDSKIEVHIKINTGMNRQGIKPEEVDECIAILTHLSLDTLHTGIKITGFASHFAEADCILPEISAKTVKQISIWNSLVKILRQRPEFSGNGVVFHISNTAGANFSGKPSGKNKNPALEIEADVYRIGIGLYGYSDIKAHEKNLVPALSMNSIISGIYNIKIGDSVGYNSTWIAKRNSVIATIPAGYYEGMDRRLSNKGHVYVHATGTDTNLPHQFKCPIIGKVSMNITSIDITDAVSLAEKEGLEIALGSKVVIIGPNLNARDIGNMCETIPYEILVHIHDQLKRIYK